MSPDSGSTGPTAAARRHTMAGTKPIRPRPPPISPQAHESHEIPSSTRPKPSPANVQPTPPASSSLEAMYATVKKPKRHPPPSMPAPPPPYKEDDVSGLFSAEPVTTPTTPATAKAPSQTLTRVQESLKPHPHDGTDGGSTHNTSGSGDGSGFTPGTGGSGSKQRPPRPAPSRPARPPAGK